ncbi:beta-galactosidase [Agarivorans albus]|uniref:Agarase n=1 Tax=Agarivorans albus MKT 106 TaxID=1331007 RepID=R9PU29_AGAAL|nr:beta-galactosidase [Agarivorans albus]GAD03451.1 agarase [Agarivorans albus MKT 106]
MLFKKSNLAILVSVVLAGVSTSNVIADDTKQSSENAATSGDMTSAATPLDFTEPAVLEKITNSHSQFSVLKKTAEQSKDGLKMNFDAISEAEAQSKWPNVKIHSKAGPWDWNTKGGLKVALENPGSEDVRIEMKVSDNIGIMGSADNQVDLPIILPAGKTTTVDFLFNGTQMNIDGYRGGAKLNLKSIAEIQFYSVGPIAAQEVVIRDINFIERTGDFVKSEAREAEVIAAPIPTLLALSDFDDGSKGIVSKTHGTTITSVKRDEGKGLKIDYSADASYPSVTFSADKPWNWSEHGDFTLALDIENIGDAGAQLFIRVDDDVNEKQGGSANGVIHSRTGYVQLPAGEAGTYYFTLEELAKTLDSGMRGEPPKKSYQAQAINFGWGEQKLDLSNIVSFQLYMQDLQKDLSLVIDNIRLVPNLSADTSRYEGLLDEFGQFTNEDWAEKIHSAEELQAHAKADVKLIDSAKPMDDRTPYGGWKNGPKLEATGYFRTEKVDGKWSLVDPSGYLYFATGLDNIRMDDTYTTTGVGFTDLVLSEDLSLRPSQISQDSYVDNQDARSVASQLRNSMFTWLPSYQDALAQNYQYSTMIHTGPLEHGEVYSFYSANLQRKYAPDSRDEAIAVWRDVTLARMLDWGFTSLGNWADPSFYGNQKVAYVANGWIVGDHQRINTGNDYWGPMHDPYDPEFVESVKTMAKQVAAEVEQDPWCIGTFVDNEMSWGNTEFDANHYALAIAALRADAKDSFAKAAFVGLLEAKYAQDIQALNKAWGSELKSWDELAKGYVHQGDLNDALKADYSMFLADHSDRYFAIVQQQMKQVLPNHLYLGARFTEWGITPEAANSAAQYVDVMSYNLYGNDMSKGDWSHLAELDMPSIIGEFHFGATDSGMFHPGLVAADTQQGRAEKYAHYMDSVIANPYFVGAHWFQYLDSPTTGRAWDGENYNNGFVTVADSPYEKLVAGAAEVNRKLYPQRYPELVK